jgi:hypothetical protein
MPFIYQFFDYLDQEARAEYRPIDIEHGHFLFAHAYMVHQKMLH